MYGFAIAPRHDGIFLLLTHNSVLVPRIQSKWMATTTKVGNKESHMKRWSRKHEKKYYESKERPQQKTKFKWIAIEANTECERDKRRRRRRRALVWKMCSAFARPECAVQWIKYCCGRDKKSLRKKTMQKTMERKSKSTSYINDNLDDAFYSNKFLAFMVCLMVCECAVLCCASLVFHLIFFLLLFSLWIRAEYTGNVVMFYGRKKIIYINKATRSGTSWLHSFFCIYSHSLPHWRKPLPYSILHTRATWCAHNNVYARADRTQLFPRKNIFIFFSSENLFSWVWKVGNLFLFFTHSVYVDLLIQGNDNNKTISESGSAYRTSLSCVTTKLLDSIKLRSQLGLILWKCGI